MPLVRRLGALLAILLLGAAWSGAAAAAPQPGAPTGLHGFLLRVDEPRTTSFPRTPAFAWNPVAGATGYEFQLSVSSTFRDNGIVWQCPSAKCPGLETPVAAPGVSLPWITGSPHGLYARVRAVRKDGTETGWSAPFGFDMVPSAPPTPQTAPAGVLRWTPSPGATAYEVWLVDARKMEVVYTNVLDEREFYTLHQTPSWIGTIRWRVRALRGDWQADERVNGVPITPYGPWSPIYQTTNPAPAAGQIRLGPTVSDVVTTGRPSDPAQRLMPAFTWAGDETLAGTPAELFRVYIFTDRECLNRVYASSVVGSPAYAPRPYGALALPANGSDLAAARGSYLADLGSRGSEQPGLTYDDQKVSSTESLQAATPTTSLPAVGPSATAGAGATAAQTAPFITLASGADPGAPVSLWDTSWPQSGYYWTVVPVQMVSPGSLSTTLAAAAPKGSTTLVMAGNPGFKTGDQVELGQGATTEALTVSSVAGATVTFTTATLSDHQAGEPVVHGGGGIVYQDLELPQDVCAAGRVARFGIDSQPSLIAGLDPFASGLAPDGVLTSAVRTDSFFESPVVSWTPALGATAYQVQWSRTVAPFVPVAGPGGGAGILTGATSYVLPLPRGTWYYRVRGYDWSLPTGAQEMGWSDVARIVVSGPEFKVVPTARPRKRR